MNPEKYLTELVNDYKFKIKDFDKLPYKNIVKHIRNFDKKSINQIYFTGSTEKHTNSKRNKTIEMLISIKAKDKRSPEEISKSYANYFSSLDFKVKTNQYAICFQDKDFHFELIPSKLKKGTYNYHVLYDTISKKETVTNMNILRNDVVNSKNQNEIILMKLWRDKHQLNFPSIYLELVVIYALKRCEKKNLFSRLIRVLDYLKKDFTTDLYYDPSNTDNIVSDSISKTEKEQIKQAAKESMSKEYIRDIVS